MVGSEKLPAILHKTQKMRCGKRVDNMWKTAKTRG